MIYVLSSKKKSRMGNGEMLIPGYATELWREDGSERKRLEGRVSKTDRGAQIPLDKR